MCRLIILTEVSLSVTEIRSQSLQPLSLIIIWFENSTDGNAMHAENIFGSILSNFQMAQMAKPSNVKNYICWI